MRRRSDGVILPTPATEAREAWPEGWNASRVVEALEPFVSESRRARLLGVISERLCSVTVLMDAPHDPHNGGAVLRSCDAFGVQELHVVPRTEPFAISNTVTRGSEKWVDFLVHGSVAEAVASLHGRGFELVASHPRGELVPEDLSRIPRVALVLGNERDGIREELERAADRTVRVPMRGFVESLNMSVSASILLNGATRGRPGDLDDHRRTLLYARGLYRTLSHAAEVLAAKS